MNFGGKVPKMRETKIVDIGPYKHIYSIDSEQPPLLYEHNDIGQF